ncbi:hypothetical protein [Absidia glauca]|uniref:Uncharacterized protein n=1 Tax=Absidia glauca TaxID=4829 RepID=A0A168MV00_ABSGL|nr:hypothetical protein [Absidia glauca]
MSTLTRVHTAKAPAAIGPYGKPTNPASSALSLTTSIGLAPFCPFHSASHQSEWYGVHFWFPSGHSRNRYSLTGRNIVDGGIVEQTHQSITNMSEVLKEAGSDLNNVVKTTVFLKDMNQFVAMNEVYSKYFDTHQPARSCVEVARLPKDVAVEIECVAVIKDSNRSNL